MKEQAMPPARSGRPDRRIAEINAILKSENKPLFDYLYACLNVLDAKSNSLLQFNSIILVAFGTALHGSELGPFMKWLSFAGIFLTLTSSLLLLSVVLVRWLTEPEYAHFDQDFLRLRDQRTVRYKIAWLLSLVTVLIVGIGVYRIFVPCGGRIDNC
jgi:hypothetical protein